MLFYRHLKKRSIGKACEKFNLTKTKDVIALIIKSL